MEKLKASMMYLDFDLVEGFAIVDTNYRSNHFRHNHHVTKVSLDGGRLLVGLLGLECRTQLLDQGHGLALQTAVKFATNTRTDHFQELLNYRMKYYWH